MSVELTVIIVNWNGASHLPRCLSALARQTLQPKRILLVDNASSDDSLAYVRDRHPEVRVLAPGRNLGFAAANNLAVREVATDWLVTLNPDAFPEPGWLQGFADAVEANPEAGSFAGLLVQAEDRERRSRALPEDFLISMPIHRPRARISAMLSCGRARSASAR